MIPLLFLPQRYSVYSRPLESEIGDVEVEMSKHGYQVLVLGTSKVVDSATLTFTWYRYWPIFYYNIV